MGPSTSGSPVAESGVQRHVRKGLERMREKEGRQASTSTSLSGLLPLDLLPHHSSSLGELLNSLRLLPCGRSPSFSTAFFVMIFIFQAAPPFFLFIVSPAPDNQISPALYTPPTSSPSLLSSPPTTHSSSSPPYSGPPASPQT